jgi:hypothetical protein
MYQPGKNQDPLFKWNPFIGFILLSGIVIFLLTSTVYQAWRSHSLGGIFALVVLIGALITIFYEGRSLIQRIKSPSQTAYSKIIFEFLAVVIGGLLAYIFSLDIGMGPVVAASLVGIISHLVFPDYGVPVYCGAFVGMTSEILLYSHLEVAIASLAAGIVFILTRKVFIGLGGKLGSIALIGTAATGFGLSRAFLSTPISDWRTNGLVILVALIAAPLTYFFNRHKNNGPVLASGVVGLASGLILPELFPVHGETFAVVAICASFTGMTSNDRCPNFWHMFTAGLFTGMIFVYSTPLLGGAGGKLGTIAFGSVLSACGYARIIHWIKNKTGDKRLQTDC